jgi:hypothetical protein
MKSKLAGFLEVLPQLSSRDGTAVDKPRCHAERIADDRFQLQQTSIYLNTFLLLIPYSFLKHPLSHAVCLTCPSLHITKRKLRVSAKSTQVITGIWPGGGTVIG